MTELSTCTPFVYGINNLLYLSATSACSYWYVISGMATMATMELMN